jgi:hypothetical protein
MMNEKIWYALCFSIAGLLLLTALWANLADRRPLERRYVLLELHPDWKKVSESSAYMRTER